MTDEGRRSLVDDRGLAVGLALLAVVAAALAVWFRADTAASATPAVTAEQSSAVTGDVSAAMERLWSYDHRDLGGLASLEPVTTAEFLEEYGPVYERIEKLAPATEAVVEAQVAEIAVSAIDGDRATLLVFLDQRATKGQEKPVDGGSRLRVEATQEDGTWVVDGVTPF